MKRPTIKHIIVEGPDGAGKSTLVEHLAINTDHAVHQKASDSKTGPVDWLAKWVYLDIANNHEDLTKTPFIYDRYPTMSEPIYGQLIRGGAIPPFDDQDYLRAIRDTLYKTSVVVWCLPDLATVSANVSANSRDQMPGVVANIGKVHQAYMTAYFRWRGPKMRYDYTHMDKTWLTYNLMRAVFND